MDRLLVTAAIGVCVAALVIRLAAFVSDDLGQPEIRLGVVAGVVAAALVTRPAIQRLRRDIRDR